METRLSIDEVVTAGQYIKEKAYWLGQLSGNLVKSSFYPDNKQRNDKKRTFEKEQFRITGELSERLARLRNNSDFQLHMILAAGLIALTAKYTGNNDIIIGSPFYKPDEDKNFINTVLVLRNCLHPGMTFKELLLQVKQTIVEAVENINYPIDVLLKQLDIPFPDNEDFPLFDIALLLENIQDKKYLQHIRHNVTFSFQRAENSLEGVVEFNSRLYHKETIRRIIAHLIALFQQALFNVDLELTGIDILSDVEKKQLLYQLNDTQTPYPHDRTIHQLFEAQAQQTPDKTAVYAPVDANEAFNVSGCFKKNPYIYKTDMDLNPDTGAGHTPEGKTVILLKTHYHNSIILNENMAKLLDRFDGKRNLGSIFASMDDLKDITFTLYDVDINDLLEITHNFKGEVKTFANMDFDTFISLVRLLHNNHLLEPTARPLQQNDKNKLKPDDFDKMESFNEQEILHGLLNPGKELTRVDVLLLGDTPGMPTTGLLYLASFLKRNGVKACCRFYDQTGDYQSMKQDIETLLDRLQPSTAAISMKWFPYIGRVLDMCEIIRGYSREKNIPIKIVVGGNTASYYWEHIIEFDCIDYVIRGDGELPLLQICRQEYPVPNSVYKDPENGKIVTTPITYIKDKNNSQQVYLSHLDEILLSDKASLLGTFFIYTHLGCAMNCHYCGGCRQAQEQTFNRKGVFIRPAQEVRKDIREVLPYVSTFQFDFDNPITHLEEYCRNLWEGIDLSGHFCIITCLRLPSASLIERVSRTFKYVYWDLDMLTLSGRHREQLESLKLVKPQPTDAELLTFLSHCESHANVEVRINLIAGLPCMTKDDIEAGEKFLSHIMVNYTCFSELHWARLHAQPGAPIVDNAPKYNMRAYATTFEEFFEYSKKNFNSSSGYQRLEDLNYPYIYYNEDSLNSKITRYYTEVNQNVRQYRESRKIRRIPAQTFTYRQLDQRADLLARLLNKRGAARDSIVAVMLPPSVDIPLAVLAVLKAGAGYLPIDPQYPEERLKYILKDSNCKQVITLSHLAGNLAPSLREIGVDIIDTRDNHIYTEEISKPSNKTDSSTVAYTIYTSGTTGKPKGVLLTHRNLVNYVFWFKQTTELTAEDNALLASSFAFDLGYSSFYPSLLTGAGLHIIPKETYLLADRLLNYIKWNRVTYLKVTPSLFSIIARSPEFSAETCRHLRFILMGGEAINVDDVEKTHQVCSHIQIMNHYGPTEATIGCVARFIDFHCFQDYKKRPTIGKPINNSNVYILDKKSNLLPPGVPGELVISGACLARGYLNRPQLTSEKFLENPHIPGEVMYRTGDLTRFLPDGNIQFLGRIDNQVKVRGYRIELEEIENQLVKHPKVKEAVIIPANGNPGQAAENTSGASHLLAYIVPDKEDIKMNVPRYEREHPLSLEDIRKKEQFVEPPEDYPGLKKERIQRSIVSHFEEQAKKNQNKTAVQSNGKSITFGQLNRRANQVAYSILAEYNDKFKLSVSEKSRYKKQMLLHGWGMEGQEKLKSTTVFVAGAGDGGSPTIMQLALIGFGTIKVCDPGDVELSDLNRQFLHHQERLGMNKALSAKMTLNKINPYVDVIPYTREITKENVFELVGDSELIFDMTDDSAVKFILSECAVVKHIPHIVVSGTNLNAYAAVFHTPDTPCYHCIFAKEKLQRIIAGMENYIENYTRYPLPIVPTPLFISTGTAVNEALKIVLDLGTPAYNTFFYFNQGGAARNLSYTPGFKAITHLFSDHFRKISKRQGFDWDSGWRGNFMETLTLEPDPLCRLCGTKGEEIRKKLAEHIKKAGKTASPIHIKDEKTAKKNENEKRQTVALLMNHNLHMALGCIGALKAGKTYIPMDPADTADRLIYMLTDSEARLIITDSDNLELAGSLRDKVNKNIKIIPITGINEDEAIEASKTGNPDTRIEPDHIAYLLYPPAAAGKPEVLMESHDGVLDFIRAHTYNVHNNPENNNGSGSLSYFGFKAARIDLYEALLTGSGQYAPDAEEKDRDPLSSSLREFLLKRVPDFMIPSYFVQLERIPLTPNGKIDKKALPEPETPAQAEENAIPRSEVEKKLADIWSEVLEIDKNTIGINSNFFELGGHSLKVTTLITKIQTELSTTLSLSEIFAVPTIKALAEHIKADAGENMNSQDRQGNLVLLNKGTGKVSNFFMIHGGGGEVEVYTEFCSRLNRAFNYWGIRANRFENYDLPNLTIEEIAAQYIEIIKKIQPHGPYYMAGWCLGGTIAFEMARHLEHMKEEISYFALIDSSPPDPEQLKYANKFSLEAEANWIAQYLPDEEIKEKVKASTRLSQVWPLVVDYLENADFDIQGIRRLIPANMAEAIPNFDRLGIRDLVYYLNVIRIFDNARAFYSPAGTLSVPVHYFAASQSTDISHKNWNSHCSKPLQAYRVSGDHTSIFQTPSVIKFARLFDQSMTDGIKEEINNAASL